MEAEDKKSKETPKIDIYKAWCKGCGICAAFCPAGVLARDEAGYPYVKDPERCLNCGLCEMRCPDFAITVEKRRQGAKKGVAKSLNVNVKGKGTTGEKEG